MKPIMKKLLGAFFALTIMATMLPSETTAQALYYNGKNVALKFPRGIDSSKVYTFPSFKYREPLSWDDTVAVSVTDLETYVTADSLAGNTLVNISRNAYVYAGAKLYLKLSSTATDTLRTVYVKDGSTVVDTITVGRLSYRNYFYNGYTFQKTDNSSGVAYLGTVTQSSSITTGVALNADAGVITTVSATIAADDSSASFTFTNSFIKSTSVIMLTAGTSGNGTPYATITSQTAGSAVIKLWNQHRQAALNATVKIHFLILNK